MSEDSRTSPPAPTASADTTAPSAAPAVSIWPAATLREQLRAIDAPSRLRALAQAVQPKAALDECVDDVVHCATLSAEDPTALRVAAIALGAVARDRLGEVALGCLSNLTAAKEDVHVRIAAAHALYRQQRVPESAFSGLAGLLTHELEPARKVAALALSLAGSAPAAHIASTMAAISPAYWTTEGLGALVASSGNVSDRLRAVEQFVQRGMKELPLLPGGIAAYTALARLGTGSALNALLKIATESNERSHWLAALDALAGLGQIAMPAIAPLARALETIDDPEHEEALCRTLVQLRAPAAQLPLKRIVARVASAPDRSCAAHCMLLTLHAKEFAAAARALTARFGDASDALRKVLSKTHELLTGLPIEQSQPV